MLGISEDLKMRGARVEEACPYEWALPEDTAPLRALVRAAGMTTHPGASTASSLGHSGRPGLHAELVAFRILHHGERLVVPDHAGAKRS